MAIQLRMGSHTSAWALSAACQSHLALIVVPILIQVYFNASLAYGLMRLLKVEHTTAASGALIGASNFFELAVATAIALFGPEPGAAWPPSPSGGSMPARSSSWAPPVRSRRM